MSEPSIKAESLTEAEQQWLIDQRSICADLVSGLLKVDRRAVPTIRDLHNAFDVWLEQFMRGTGKRKLFSKKPPTIDPNSIALSFGVVLGDHISSATSLEWMIVTDAYGTDMMLYAAGKQEGYTDVVNAPMNMVAKRIESRTSDWIEPTYTALIEELQRTSS